MAKTVWLLKYNDPETDAEILKAISTTLGGAIQYLIDQQMTLRGQDFVLQPHSHDDGRSEWRCRFFLDGVQHCFEVLERPLV